MKKRVWAFILGIILVSLPVCRLSALAAASGSREALETEASGNRESAMRISPGNTDFLTYYDFEQRFRETMTVEEIPLKGFTVIEEQVFSNSFRFQFVFI